MIDFNPEEQTITIPASYVNSSRESQSITGLQNASQLEMIVHQRWAIAILRVKSIDMNLKVTWSLRIPGRNPSSEERKEILPSA